MKFTVTKSFSSEYSLLEQRPRKEISRLKEIEIINQSKADISSFKPLYELYHHQIVNYIYQKVGDKQIASDITSQVFLKVITNLKSYKIQAVPFSAWIYKIAYNETMMFFRKSKKMRQVVLDDIAVGGIAEELQEFPREQILSSIESMIRQMNKKDVELIELRFYQGKSFQEIGFILGCTESAAKVRSHRLLKKIRKELKKNYRHEEL